MNKQQLKEQIKYGKCDPKLFQQARIVEGVTDPAVIEFLSKRATLIEIKKNKSIMFEINKYYKLLFGDFELRDNRMYATQNCDFVVLDKSLVEYFQNQEVVQQFDHNIKYLKRISIFQQMDYYSLQKLSASSQSIRVNEDRILYSEGQVPPDCIIIIKGGLELYKNIQGIKIKVDQNRKHIGIYECLNSQKLQYNVRTTKETLLLKFSREVLLNFESELRLKNELNYDCNVGRQEVEKQKQWQKFKKRVLVDLSVELNNKRVLRSLRIHSQY